MFGFTSFQLFCLPQRERLLVFLGASRYDKKTSDRKESEQYLSHSKGPVHRAKFPEKYAGSEGIYHCVSASLTKINQQQR